MDKIVIMEKEAGISILKLNRPEKLNAMNRRLLRELIDNLESISRDKETGGVIITGEGKGFCVGGDLEEHPAFREDDAMLREEFIREAQNVTLMLRQLSKPVIAAINGVAAGAGLDLAMACDIRIASETAKFGEVFVLAGGMPDMGGTYFLPRLVGLGKAMELALTGDYIDAGEAHRIGLVNRVVPPSELMPNAMALCRRFTKGSADSYRLIKWALYRGLEQNLEQALENELYGQNILLGTEYMKAFAKKFSRKNT
ncbi:MAG: enoyl-CoA hydratase/isomerase family protein [Deltaproteobacteria bacterium]|nr:enoyl-CoA hydratase/isomerase family protein [Deltaproteobacteria bacterium]